MTCKTRSDTQLLVVLISSEAAEVVSLGVEEEIIQMGNGAFDRRRLAGTELFVNVDKSVGIILCLILLQDSLFQPFVGTEQLIYLLVRADAQCADKGS